MAEQTHRSCDLRGSRGGVERRLRVGSWQTKGHLRHAGRTATAANSPPPVVLGRGLR